MNSDLVDLLLFVVAGGLVGLLIRYVRYLNRPRKWAPSWSTPLHFGLGALGGAIFLGYAQRFGFVMPHVDWLLVAALGGAVGIGELASRYRDEPIKAILSIPATMYVLLNAAAAVFALALGRYYGWWEIVEDPISGSQVMIAGLGAMVLLRSSVFRIKVGDQDVAVGPSTFLQSLIDAADRAVDRLRAQERAWAVANVMEGIATEKVLSALPLYISLLMQNLSPEEVAKFNERAETIRRSGASEVIKRLSFGLLTMNHAGPEVLRAAVQSLAAEIRESADQTAQQAEDAAAVARESKAATEEVVAAVDRVAKSIAGSAPEVLQSVRESATTAGTVAQDALDQVQRAAESAQDTVAVAAAAERVLDAGGKAMTTVEEALSASGTASAAADRPQNGQEEDGTSRAVASAA